ncbi:MAG: amidohydrolase family protein [Cyclobacteriaceae bacterium]
MTNPFKSFRYTLFILPVFIHACSSNTQEKFYSEADFPNVQKSDVHVHIFNDNNDFMEQAAKDNFKVVTVALDADNKIGEVRRQFRFCALQQKNKPSAVESATAFSMEGWDEPDWLEKNVAWLDSSINDGAIAVKIWKNIGMSYRDKDNKLIMIDDPKFDPIFKMLSERKIPVIGHLGEPKNCWLPFEEMTTNNDRNYFRDHPQYHMHQHPDFPSYEDQIRARDNMLEKNPDLNFVGAHLGSLEWDVDELAKRFDKFPNMAVDMAARMGQLFYQTHLNRDKVREFFIKYQDRLLYATDMGASEGQEKEALWKEMHETWLRDWKYFVTEDKMTSNLVNQDFQGLKLPADVVDKIYYQNAKRWLNAFEDKNTKGVSSAQ